MVVMQAPNARTDPQQKIRRITDTWPSDDRSPFYGIQPQQPLAKLHIRRLSQQVTLLTVRVETSYSILFSVGLKVLVADM